MTQNIEGLQATLTATRQAMYDFARESTHLAEETDIEQLREMVKLRAAYVKSLAMEMKLKQAERGIFADISAYLFGIKRK